MITQPNLTVYKHWCHREGWFLCSACQQELVDYLTDWMVVNPYRKRIEIDRDKDYYWVELGVLSKAHGGASYPFPTYEAARAFALHHKHRDIHRSVSVIYPDGSQHPIRWEEVTGYDPDPYVRDDLLGENDLEQQAYYPVPPGIIQARRTRIQRGV